MAEPINARYAGDAARIAAIALFGLAILWPIICVTLHGYTLTGVFEESVGYRYFYSLRKLYDPPTYLFTAQGQSIDIIQALIQIALTWLGYPTTQVQPRIDHFCYASMIVFQLLNLGAFAWMIWRVESLAAIVIAPLFWLVPFYEPHLSGMYTLLQPDYMTLECAFALVAAGSILRTRQSSKLEGRQVAFFGVFVGVAASTKITFLVFPAAALAFAVLQERAVRIIVVKLCQVSVIAFLCGLLIVFADTEWHIRYVSRGAKDLLSFIAAGSGDIVKQNYSWPVWFVRQIYQSPLYLALVYATPVFTLIALLISRTRKQIVLSVPLLLIAIGSNYFLYKRDYPNTLIEAAFFFQLAFFVLVPLILLPRLLKNVARVALLLEMPIAALLCMFIVSWYSIGVGAVVTCIKQNTEEQKGLAAVQKRTAGNHIWLV
ncbi:MAG TPA: hypothetical protein VMF32_13695, partial [Xanthobacteraceae bacterium]|nr:hypothetical protein [Xanthobacteraceae bacterium]